MSYQLIIRSECPMCFNSLKNCKRLGQRLDHSLGFRIKNKKEKGLDVYRCRKCRTHFSDSIVLFAEEHFKSDYKGAVPVYDTVPFAGSFSNELKLLSAYFSKPFKELSALDAGFGFGNTLLVLKEEFKEVTGIEAFKAIYEYAVQHPKMKGLKEKLLNVAVENAELPSGSFDLIFLEAIQHVSDPDAVLKKALKWLKPNGIIYMEVPSSAWLMSELMNFYYYLRGTKFVCNLNPLHGNYSNYEFSKQSFELNGTRNNYKVLQTVNYTCNTQLKGVFNSFFRMIMNFTGKGMQMGVVIQKCD